MKTQHYLAVGIGIVGKLVVNNLYARLFFKPVLEKLAHPHAGGEIVVALRLNNDHLAVFL